MKLLAAATALTLTVSPALAQQTTPQPPTISMAKVRIINTLEDLHPLPTHAYVQHIHRAMVWRRQNPNLDISDMPDTFLPHLNEQPLSTLRTWLGCRGTCMGRQ